MFAIYLAPFIPESHSGFMSSTQRSIHPALNENTPANIWRKTWTSPGKGQHSLSQTDMRQAWIP